MVIVLGQDGQNPLGCARMAGPGFARRGDQGGDEVAFTCDLEFLAWHERRDQLWQSGLGFLDRNGMHARAPTLSLGREIRGKENQNQLPLSVSFPGATPARRVGSFSGYPFVMIFLAVVIRDTTNPALTMKRPWAGRPCGQELAQSADHSCAIGVANPGSPSAAARQRSWAQQPRTASSARSANSKGAKIGAP